MCTKSVSRYRGADSGAQETQPVSKKRYTKKGRFVATAGATKRVYFECEVVQLGGDWLQRRSPKAWAWEVDVHTGPLKINS